MLSWRVQRYRCLYYFCNILDNRNILILWICVTFINYICSLGSVISYSNIPEIFCVLQTIKELIL
jgi:hypothetical protein